MKLSYVLKTLCDEVLQKIAAEMNLSETAFIRLLDQGDTFEKSATFGLRWFTPATEVKLCGHATLASAAILFNKLGNQSDKIVFKTLSGDLIVGRDGDWVVMDFPLGRTVSHSKDKYGALIKSLGDIPGVEDLVYCKSLRYLLIRLKDGWSRCQFEDWTPDINQMQPSTDDLFVLIVTTRALLVRVSRTIKGKSMTLFPGCLVHGQVFLKTPLRAQLKQFWLTTGLRSVAKPNFSLASVQDVLEKSVFASREIAWKSAVK
ncbi:phenazine biosynthesis-like domain-containing protein 1 isoform X2 [Gigantopelta aegis]|uniref:phenazine biosynthesis-like domain-containing protein 1 isoform X2 n=1 Tax=Gigantopelta aegis TaxID=1735272 RepID=UPI001B887A51|nr:phenazine biosynthesis-like domain-containing protein 1 isoform X2 [Gigantopelta aegis]